MEKRALGLPSKLAEVKYEIRGRVLLEAEKCAANGTDILPLHIGNPGPFGFEPPAEVLKATKEAVTASLSYSDSRGLKTLVHKVQERLQNQGSPEVPFDHIYIGNGVSELIMMACQCAFSRGDEVLVPAPDYPLWTAAIKLTGATPVYYLCDEAEDWQPSLSDLRSKVNDKTKAIVLINPNNPTGAVYSDTALTELAKFVSENNLLAFSDEIYSQILFDDAQFYPFAKVLNQVDPRAICLSFDGLSKNGFAAGYRCGWMTLTGDLSDSRGFLDGLNMLSALRLCPNVLAMHSAIAFLNTSASGRLEDATMQRLIQQRAALCDGLRQIEHLSFVEPKGAFYVFPRIDLKKTAFATDEDFAIKLVQDFGILTVPGSAFNSFDEEHVRLVFLPRTDLLQTVCRNLNSLLSSTDTGHTKAEKRPSIA